MSSDKSTTPSKWRGSPEAPFTWISNHALERVREIGTSSTLAVFAALCWLESRTPSAHKGQFYASYTEIRNASGVSANSLRRHLSLLESAKLISVQRPKGKAKIQHSASKYTVLRRRKIGTPEGAKSIQTEAQSTRSKSILKKDNPPLQGEGDLSYSASRFLSMEGGGDAPSSPKRSGRSGSEATSTKTQPSDQGVYQW